MKIFKDKSNPDFIELVQTGGVAVLRTDTLYGIIARADDQQAVEKVYTIKGRRYDKASIVLISHTSQLYDPLTLDVSGMWPGRNSIILPSLSAPTWLLRGGTTLAYRVPDDPSLLQLIDAVGPLIAPSANPEDQTPAETITQAIRYFGEDVDGYVDGGVVAADTEASKLWTIKDGKWQRLR